MTASLPATKTQFDTSESSRTALIFLALALIMGGILRAIPLLSHPFAVNDGGLFWAMTRAIEAHNFALPATVFYPTDNTPNLPFCYPPLGFYVAALLSKIGLPLALVFQWLPWAWSMATIWAFWRLARTFCANQENGAWAAGAATLGWALLPWSFAWHVMGGGLTRAPGLVWAFLAIEAALVLWRDTPRDKPQLKQWLWLTLWLALTLLTHLERARFAIVAVGLVWLFYGRSARGLAQVAGALFGAALLSAPWWGLCITRFGLAPFRAAAGSGGGDWQSGSALEKLVGSATLSLSGEAILPAFHLVGAVGLLWLLWRRQWFVPLWFALILLLEVRSGRVFIIAPLALSVGLMLASVPRARTGVIAVLALWLCLLSSIVQTGIPALSENDLAAMRWAKTNAPDDARFLVIPSNQWGMDAPAEWFPALAERASVATVQGAEWLPGGEFRRRAQRHDKLRKLKSWNAAQDAPDTPSFDWVWRPDKAPKWELDDSWEKVWSRGDNAIWRRVEQLEL